MNLSLKSPWIKGTFLEISIGSPWILVLCILNWKFEWIQVFKRYKSQFSPKKVQLPLLAAAYKLNIFPVPLAHINYRTIVIISFISQEYLHVFMLLYIMCFNVSICFKMGSLCCYCGIITKLVYPQEFSRIAGFCTNSNENFSGGGPPDPPFKQDYLMLYYNHNTANHLKKVKKHIPKSPPPHHFSGELKIKWSLYVLFEKSIVDLFSQMDVWKNKEKSLKSPWKCTSKVLEKSFKNVCHDLWEPWLKTSFILVSYNWIWALSIQYFVFKLNTLKVSRKLGIFVPLLGNKDTISHWDWVLITDPNWLEKNPGITKRCPAL